MERHQGKQLVCVRVGCQACERGVRTLGWDFSTNTGELHVSVLSRILLLYETKCLVELITFSPVGKRRIESVDVFV